MAGAPLDAERVEIGFEMAAHPVGADQVAGRGSKSVAAR